MASVILYAAEYDQSDAGSLSLEDIEDIFFSQVVFSCRRGNFQDGRARIETMSAGLRCECILEATSKSQD